MGGRADQILGAVEVPLGDRRLQRRLTRLLEALAAQPEVPLGQACADWAGQQAAYRFFANPAVRVEALVAALGAATAARCPPGDPVLVIQDTTSLDYTSHPATADLGALEHPRTRGLLLHTCLAVSPAGLPLGVLDLALWTRPTLADPGDDRRHRVPIDGKESAKWLRGLRQAAARLGPGRPVLTIADREADLYELFLLAHELGSDWLIRARHDRALAGDTGRLVAAVEQAPVAGTLELAVPRGPDRPARTATLAVQARTVVLVPPRPHPRADAAWWAAHPTAARVAARAVGPLRVGVVLVTEPSPPSGTAPVRWLLLTSRRVETLADALACVRLYRWRWLIERFHFILKSGCRVERLQLRAGARLQRALAVYAGVAGWLLWLQEQARATPDAPCTVAVSEAAWQALLATSQRSLVLPVTPPSLRTVVRLLARLGGFLGRRGDGEPGVQTLWRGVRRLHDLETTWQLLHPPQPPDPPPQPTCVQR
jgi:hypothetical protein